MQNERNGSAGTPDGPFPGSEDRMLTVGQAAEMLNVTEAWLYRRSKSLPFARRYSPKMLRFSEKGLRRWLDRQ
jgi:hypothetical protein